MFRIGDTVQISPEAWEWGNDTVFRDLSLKEIYRIDGVYNCTTCDEPHTIYHLCATPCEHWCEENWLTGAIDTKPIRRLELVHSR